jgi:hypothetical protein
MTTAIDPDLPQLGAGGVGGRGDGGQRRLRRVLPRNQPPAQRRAPARKAALHACPLPPHLQHPPPPTTHAAQPNRLLAHARKHTSQIQSGAMWARTVGRAGAPSSTPRRPATPSPPAVARRAAPSTRAHAAAPPQLPPAPRSATAARHPHWLSPGGCGRRPRSGRPRHPPHRRPPPAARPHAPAARRSRRARCRTRLVSPTCPPPQPCGASRAR